jgi:glycosyltransferase involved in cell wall biosynthesis
LIMDGCSSDRTLEIAHSFPHLTVHSGRDRGLYDAMNRGAFFARGEWLIFLQADDWLPEGALAAFQAAMGKNPAAEILTGSAEAVHQIGESLWETRWQRASAADKALTIENIALGEPMLNARAIRKSLFKKTGPFDLAYSLASDRDFLLKLTALQPQVATIDAPTYRYRWHNGSRTMNAGNSLSRRLAAENLAIARKHLSALSWTAEDKLSLRAWHSRQSLQAALCALEAFDPIGFVRVVPQAVTRDPSWPLHSPGSLRNVLRAGSAGAFAQSRNSVACSPGKNRPVKNHRADFFAWLICQRSESPLFWNTFIRLIKSKASRKDSATNQSKSHAKSQNLTCEKSVERLQYAGAFGSPCCNSFLFFAAAGLV